jgi:homoserine dehydrogenase
LTLKPEEVFHYGIRHIKGQDVQFASEKGYRIKLFSRAEKINGKLIGFVAPHFVKQDHVSYNVNNEFNAVIVEALFSDRQLFLGKGAGAYPTASAVLSDISALQYDYNYEYKKENSTDVTEFTKDFVVKIYAGSSSLEELKKIKWINQDSNYQSKEYNYTIGTVSFAELSKLNFNEEENLFFAVLPEELNSLNKKNDYIREEILVEN